MIVGCTKVYTVTFNTDGGNELGKIKLESKKKLTLPNPEKLGYTFDGWYSDEALSEEFNETVMPKKNIIVYAKWVINQYTITFNSNGGNNVTEISEGYGTSIVAPTAPTKMGFTFIGWFENEELSTAYTFNTMPAADITLFAKWVIDQYTITFNSNGGSNVSEIEGNYETSIVAPTAPTKEGYTFGDWYIDEELTTTYLFTTMPAADITLYAKWLINGYTITLNSNDGSVEKTIVGDYSSIITTPVDPIREGYTFVGWYRDLNLSTSYSFTTMPAENITLYAKWLIDHYTITFNSNGGSQVAEITEEYGTSISEPTVPTKEGYTFGGWYIDEELTTAYLFTTMGALDITVYAKWVENEYTITFDSNDGSQVAEITASYNTVVVEPSQPTKEGYTFGGWYIDEELTTAYLFTTMPALDITVYAMWVVNEYTITFDSNNGSLVAEITAAYNTVVVEPSQPTKEGYTFGGWYIDEEKTTPYLFTTMGALDITVYASWTFIPSSGLVYQLSADENSYIIIDCSYTDIIAIPAFHLNLPVSRINNNAFYGDIATKVIFEEGSQITEISDGAFMNTRITSITIPNSVTIIGYSALSGTQLTSVYIPASVATINARAFEISNLNSIDVDENNNDFSSLDGVLFNKGQTTLIKIPESITGTYTIPNSVTVILENAFERSKITAIEVDENNTNFSALEGVLFNYDQTTLIKFPETITGTYTIPNTVTKIGNRAFYNSVLTTVLFDNESQLIEISDYGFSNSELTEIVIPDSVLYIKGMAFYRADNLIRITFLSTTPPTFGGNMFTVTPQFEILVPLVALDAYKTALPTYVDYIFSIV